MLDIADEKCDSATTMFNRPHNQEIPPEGGETPRFNPLRARPLSVPQGQPDPVNTADRFAAMPPPITEFVEDFVSYGRSLYTLTPTGIARIGVIL